MKRGTIFIYFIAFLFLTNIALAAHTTTVSVTPTNSYETLKKTYTITLTNDDTSTSSINNVTISLTGFTLNEVKSLSGWSYTTNGNSVTFSTSTSAITPGFGGPFKLNTTANLIDSDTINTWNVDTIDNESSTASNTVLVTSLNDANPPNITNIVPTDYSFVKDTPINFVITATEAETNINPNYFFIGYDDNPIMTASGVVNGYIQLTQSGGNYIGTIDPSISMSLPNSPFLDYRFINLSDAAGNNYNEGNNFPHHLYVDSQSPDIIVNGPVDSFITSASLINFTFDTGDNSFETIGHGSFSPTLTCTAHINSLSNTRLYLNSVNNTGIEVDVSSLADGTYSWYIECIDAAGQSKQTASRNLIKDTTGPEIILITPLNNSVIKASDILDFDITDTLSSVNLVWYSINGIPVGSLILPYDVDTTGWLEGINKIIIYSNDTLNNLAQEEFTFIVDATPPNIVLINPPNQTLTNQDQNYYYNATDTYSTNLDCKLLVDSVEQSSKTSLSGLIDSLTVSLSTGTYEWQINCTDEVGFSNVSEIYTIIIDKDLPIINLLAPEDLSNDDDGSVTFNYSATDANNILNCSLYIDNIFNQTTLILDNFTVSLTASNTPYNWFISCYDNAQNKQDSVSRSIYYDNLVPTISEINSSSVSDTTATINWITNENTNGTIYYGLSCGNFTNSLSFDTLVNGPHSIVLTSLSPSTTYYYVINSTDQFGNQVNSSCETFTTSATPSSPGPSGGGGGGSSGGGGGITCITNWTCSDWSECSINSIQTRTCIDENACVQDSFETRSCTYKECTYNNDCLTGYFCENNKCIKQIIEEQEEETTPMTGFSILDFLGENKRGIGAGVAMIAIILCLVYLYGLRKRPKLINPEIIKETIRTGKINN